MINISDEVKRLYKAVNSNEVTKDYKISINNGAINLSNKDLVYGSFKLEQKLCSADSLTFGECNAAMVQFQCASCIGDVKGKELTLSQNVCSDLISDTLNLGTYIIDSCEITENKKYRTITAYDNIYKFNVNVSAWYEKLAFPISMINMFKSLCAYVGVSHSVSSLLNGTLMIDKTVSSDDLQGITVLKCIAELNGGFFRANEKGIIEFVQLSVQPKEELEVKLYSSLKKEDYTTLVYDKLNIRMEDGDIGVISGSGDNAYIIEDNFLIYGKSSAILQPISDKIFNVIKNITYVPFTSTQIGLPYIQVGDYIKYDTLIGSFSSFILTRTLTGTQILKDSIETKGTERTGETFGVEKEIIKLKGKSNVLTRSIEETNQTISDLNTKLTNNYSTTTDMKSAIEQSASGIKQEVSKNYQSIARAESDLEEAKSYADEVGSNVDTKAKGYANTAEANAKKDTIARLKVYSTTEQMNSAISQSADSIKLEINKETDIKLEEVVSNIDIGATNLFAGSTIYQKDTKLSVTATKNMFYKNFKEIYVDLVENETYTVNCESDGTWDATVSDEGVKMWLVNKSDESNSFVVYPAPYTFTCKKTSTYYVCLGVNKKDATHLFWNFKIEKGNKATDWSPSPYDIDSKFDDYSSKEETKSAIEAASDNINLSVERKINETNEGNLDEKEGYELISNATQKSYCVLDYIKGYTTQTSIPTPDNPIDVQNMSASFDIVSENKDKSETSNAHIELASELCAGERIIRADKDIVINGKTIKKGDWYVERCINKLKFTYEANITLVKTVKTCKCFKITPSAKKLAKSATVQYSNKYKYLNDESDVEHFYVSDTDGCIYVYDSAADVSAFKSKLAAKALEIEYQTTSKSYEALNDDSQSAMHNVVTYADYTKIYVNLATKPYIKGTFKSALYGETVESKAEIDMQSKSIVLKVDNNGNIVSVAIGEDAKDGNVVKITGNMVVGGQIKSSNYVKDQSGTLLDLLTGNIYTPSFEMTQKDGVTIKSVETDTTTDEDGYVWSNSSIINQNLSKFIKQGDRNTGNQHISIQTIIGNGIPLGYSSGKPVGKDIGLGFAKINYGTAPGTGTAYNQVMYVKFMFNNNDNFEIQTLGYGGASTPELELSVVNVGTLKQVNNAPIYVDNPLYFRKQVYPQIQGNNTVLQISHSDDSSLGLVCEKAAIRPAGNATQSLGKSGKRFSTVYAASSTISTSDKNKKHNVNVIDDEFVKKIISGLIAKSYKFDDGTSDRTHTGLIAQDIEELLNKLNIDTKDFAGFIKSPKTREIEEKVLDENGNEKTKVKVEEIEGEYDYALRYEEFISPLIRFVQLQDKDIYEMKERIKKQQQSIDELTELVKKLLSDNIDNLSESEVSEE